MRLYGIALLASQRGKLCCSRVRLIWLLAVGAGLPSALGLQMAAGELAQGIGLRLPLINAEALLQRFVRDLGLPQVHRQSALLNIYCIHRHDTERT